MISEGNETPPARNNYRAAAPPRHTDDELRTAGAAATIALLSFFFFANDCKPRVFFQGRCCAALAADRYPRRPVKITRGAK